MGAGKIAVLDPHTADQIAAGEIVERPASVVKELVENAIDAGARHIKIEIRGGGRDYIRVQDDGTGMDADDAVLAFARHATSKIRGIEDLFNVRTLGFRGEALPSIAAVARVELLTRPAGAALGTRVRIEGGRRLAVEEAGCPEGTTVTVADLFFNTPARRRHLKKPNTEASRVAGVVERLALAHPEIAFQLFVEGRRSFSTPGNNDLRSTVAALWGLDMGQNLLAVRETIDEGAGVEGLVSPPWLHRYGREQQVLIVNGRYVLSRIIAREIEAAYHTLIPQQRRPVFVLHLHLPASWLDVNVHPSKLIIKIREEEALAAQVSQAVRTALKNPAGVGSPVGPLRGRRGFPSHGPTASPPARQQEWDLLLRERGEGGPVVPAEDPPGGFAAAIYPPSPWRGEREETAAPDTAKGGLPPLRAVGQVLNTYILAEGEDGLYIIDQHAAHERCRFESLKARRPREWPTQLVEPPALLRLSPSQSLEIITCQDTLKALGFILEPFGNNTFLLRGAPAGIPVGQEGEVLEELLQEPKPEDLGSLEERLLKSIACRGAVKAGDPLGPSEWAGLLQELAASPHPHTCPHGRPAVIKISWEELARYFHRPGGTGREGSR
ncbi:MAG TPA: DNA mismatch repair endonuclease MutL [Peptococcaceae bacterium]|nr:MAG: DNA mismatch repair protein MutL [Moorella sp. 60_41]HBT48220.1 DNA mismatch repair endonuclease MutL [Peptococcaceae bacterium]